MSQTIIEMCDIFRRSSKHFGFDTEEYKPISDVDCSVLMLDYVSADSVILLSN